MDSDTSSRRRNRSRSMDQVLMMEDIVHRHSDLFGDLLEKFKVRFTIGFLLQAQKSHRTQAAVPRWSRERRKTS